MKTSTYLFNSVFSAEKVDRENGIIRGVSVITGGLVARGHDLDVDETTLNQMLSCCVDRGQVPVKENHKSGVEAVTGYLNNFRIDGAKLKGDWHILNSHPRREQYLETAERMPGGVGLSASFLGPEKNEKGKDGRAKARCTEVLSVDLVPMPAANPDGLFEAKVDSTQSAMSTTATPAVAAATPAKEPTLADVLAQLTSISSRLEAQEKFNKSVTEALNPPSLEEVAQMSDEELAELGLTQADVQEALAEAAKGGDDCDDGEDGEAVTAGAGAGAATTAMGRLEKQVKELQARLDRAATDAETAAIEHQFSSIEKSFEDLKAENDALRETVKNGGTNPVSANPEGGAAIVNFSGKKGKFEQLVELEIKGGKKKSVAFSDVRKSNAGDYEDYLQRLGVLKKA